MENRLDLQTDTVAGLAVEPDALTARSIQARVAFRMGEVVQRLEGVIQQYPWPTVLLGIGFGFLLARRVR